MKYLLDTHLLLWGAAEPVRLSPRARKILNHPETEVVFSSASLWEIAIKLGVGRAGFDCEPTAFLNALLEAGCTELPVAARHVLALRGLAPHHRDPFDRILVAQALVEGIPLLTDDRALEAYAGPVRLV